MYFCTLGPPSKGADSDNECAIVRGVGRFGTIGDDSPETDSVPPELDLRGVVETALARALMLAAEAGRWELVGRLAAELEARRIARSGGNVAPEALPLDAGPRRTQRG